MNILIGLINISLNYPLVQVNSANYHSIESHKLWIKLYRTTYSHLKCLSKVPTSHSTSNPYYI